MIAYVFKKRHGKDADGKPRIAKTYSATFQQDWMPRPRTVNLGVTDKQVANQRLQELIRNEERAQFGAVPRNIKEYAALLLEQHLQDFLMAVRSLDRSEKHLYYLGFHCRQIIAFCHWQYPKDITLWGFEQWRNASNLSAKTKNHYLGALREFCRWLELHNRLLGDPLRGVKKLSLSRVEHLRRQSLTVPQIEALLKVLPFKLKCIVSLALFTGLRRGEISRLCWEHLTLEGGTPQLVAPGSITKNGQKAVIPLHHDLAALLLQYRGKNRTGLVFGRFPEFGRLRQYWLAAGIPAEIGSGYDFHSLRVTFCTLLQNAGVALRLVQAAMRHSESRLTENIYTDVARMDLRGAIETLPDIRLARDGAVNGAVGAVKSGVSASFRDKSTVGDSLLQVSLRQQKRPVMSGPVKVKNWRRERDSNPR